MTSEYIQYLEERLKDASAFINKLETDLLLVKNYLEIEAPHNRLVLVVLGTVDLLLERITKYKQRKIVEDECQGVAIPDYFADPGDFGGLHESIKTTGEN